VWILGSIVEPAPSFLSISVADLLHRRAVGTELVGDENICATMAFHDFLQEFEGYLAITARCNEAFQDVPFVIHWPPKIVRLAVNLHEHLVQVPLPIWVSAHLADPFLADLSGKQRAKSIPLKPNRLMADVDAAFVQKIIHIPRRKRETNVHHRC
jgi:hypothetical protein